LPAPPAGQTARVSGSGCRRKARRPEIDAPRRSARPPRRLPRPGRSPRRTASDPCCGFGSKIGGQVT
jgi:hypothetical protein